MFKKFPNISFIIILIGLSSGLLSCGGVSPIGSPVASSTFRVDIFANAIAWSPDGKYLAASDQRGHHLYLWEAATGKLIAKTPNTAAINKGLTFTRDGKFILNAASSPKGLTAFSVFDGKTGKWLADVAGADPAHASFASFSAEAIFPSPDGQVVYVLHAGGESYGVYEVGSWRSLSIVELGRPTSPKTSASLSPDGKLLAIGTYSGDVQFWDTERGFLINTLKAGKDQSGKTFPYTDNHVYGLSFSPDNKQICIGMQVNQNTFDHQLQIWNTKYYNFDRYYMTGQNSNVSSLDYRGDGTVIATVDFSDAPRPIKLWDAHSNQLIRSITTDHAIRSIVKFSPNGEWLAAGGEGGVEVFRMPGNYRALR